MVLSGISCLAYALVLPGLAPFFFSTVYGSLMSKDNYFSMWLIFIQGFVCFLLNVSTRKVLVGIGGKLGTLGLISGIPTIGISYLLSMSDNSKSYNVMNILWNTDYYSFVDGWIVLFSLLAATISAIFLHYVAELKVIKRHPAPRLVSYGINTTFFGLIFLLWSNYLGEVKTVTDGSLIIRYGSYLLNYWHTGLFAAMTAKIRLSPLIKSDYLSYSILGLVSGIFNFLISGFLIVGGKHGLAALLSSLTYVLGFRLAKRLSKRLGYKQKTIKKSKKAKLLQTYNTKV